MAFGGKQVHSLAMAGGSAFPPQVRESLPEPVQFFDLLKQKAGFTTDFGSPDVKLYRYEVRKWKEA